MEVLDVSVYHDKSSPSPTNHTHTSNPVARFINLSTYYAALPAYHSHGLHNSNRRWLRRLSPIFVFDEDGDIEMTDIDDRIAST